MRRSMKLRGLAQLLAGVAIVLFCSSCEEVPSYVEHPLAAFAPQPSGYWHGDGVPGSPKIVVRKDRRPPGTHFDGAEMPYAMFFNGGYAMHQGYVPPYAASHGCIRLPRGMAEHFFEASPEGTSMTVKE